MFAAESSLFQDFGGWNVRDVEVIMLQKKKRMGEYLHSLTKTGCLFLAVRSDLNNGRCADLNSNVVNVEDIHHYQSLPL